MLTGGIKTGEDAEKFMGRTSCRSNWSWKKYDAKCRVDTEGTC